MNPQIQKHLLSYYVCISVDQECECFLSQDYNSLVSVSFDSEKQLRTVSCIMCMEKSLFPSLCYNIFSVTWTVRQPYS